MKLSCRAFQRFAALLTLLLILAYISLAFFPHAHDSRDADCALCVILQSSRDILHTLALCALLYHFYKQGVCTLGVHHRIPQMRDATPVGMKVKLSD